MPDLQSAPSLSYPIIIHDGGRRRHARQLSGTGYAGTRRHDDGMRERPIITYRYQVIAVTIYFIRSPESGSHATR